MTDDLRSRLVRVTQAALRAPAFHADAEAVVTALLQELQLQQRQEWACAIDHGGGTLDANANTFDTEAEARKHLKTLNAMFPDDRRCIVSRFLRSPWVPVCPKASGEVV